ncbi:hypothetical protein, partial [Ruminococcus sp. RTP21204st1_B2_RTP21204_210225]
ITLYYQLRRNKMSDFQKNSSNFEDLCLKIVKKLLGNSLNKIKKTQPSKDGGYDIDATIKYKNKQYSVLFECKLRGKMLTYEILQRTSLLPITIVPTA